MEKVSSPVYAVINWKSCIFAASKFKNMKKLFVLFCFYACIHIVAQTQQERIVNGVVETCDMAQSEKILLYNYTTVESRESMTALRSTSEPTRYEVLFPDYPENDDEISSMLQFKKWLHVSLGNIPNIARSLSGKTLSISFYRKADGTTICRRITLSRPCMKLLDIISTNEIKRMIDKINSYKFKASKVNGNYYLFAGVTLSFK